MGKLDYPIGEIIEQDSAWIFPCETAPKYYYGEKEIFRPNYEDSNFGNYTTYKTVLNKTLHDQWPNPRHFKCPCGRGCHPKHILITVSEIPAHFDYHKGDYQSKENDE